jgi:hypothetical protein
VTLIFGQDWEPRHLSPPVSVDNPDPFDHGIKEVETIFKCSYAISYGWFKPSIKGKMGHRGTVRHEIVLQPTTETQDRLSICLPPRSKYRSLLRSPNPVATRIPVLCHHPDERVSIGEQELPPPRRSASPSSAANEVWYHGYHVS